MEGRIISELHGFTFKCGDYKISAYIPSDNFKRGGHLVSDRDINNNSSFILLKRPDKTYGYIFYENEVYVYGELLLKGYKPENDIRHVKNRD